MRPKAASVGSGRRLRAGSPWAAASDTPLFTPRRLLCAAESKDQLVSSVEHFTDSGRREFVSAVAEFKVPRDPGASGIAAVGTEAEQFPGRGIAAPSDMSPRTQAGTTKEAVAGFCQRAAAIEH